MRRDTHPPTAGFLLLALLVAPAVAQQAAPSRAETRQLLTAIDAVEIEKDPRFADHESRLENRAALQDAIEDKLSARPTAEWVTILNAAGFPCGPIYSMDEVFADPQVKHLRMTERVEHPVDGELELLRLPLTFSETPARCWGSDK